MCVEFNHDKYHTDIKTRKNECIFKVACTNPPPFTILTKDCSPSLSFHFTHDWLSIWPIASSTKDESLPTFDEAKKSKKRNAFCRYQEYPANLRGERLSWQCTMAATSVFPLFHYINFIFHYNLNVLFWISKKNTHKLYLETSSKIDFPNNIQFLLPLVKDF